MQLELQPELARGEFEAWRQSLTTQTLLHNLRRMVTERHTQAIALRHTPATAAQWLEREYRIACFLDYIQTGDFVLPSNTQTLDKTV